MSCALITDTMPLMLINGDSKAAVARVVKARRRDFRGFMHTKYNDLALVVDGPSLAHIFDDAELTKTLMELVHTPAHARAHARTPHAHALCR